MISTVNHKLHYALSILSRFFIGAVVSVFISPLSYAVDPVSIGLSLGLSGKYQNVSQVQKNGFRLWERDVNAKGGILGRPVRLHIYDDKSDPVEARRIYQRMIEEERVDFVFAPFSSEITEAVLPVTERHGYSVIASGASADRLWTVGYRHLFGMYTPAGGIPVSFLEMLAMHNIKKVAIVYASDSFSGDIATGSRKWAERFGMEVVLYEPYADDLKDIDAMAVKVKNARPEALIVGGHLEGAISMRRALLRADWYPKAFYLPVGPGMPAFYNELKESAEYTFSTSQWERLGGYVHPGAEEFIREYENEYQEPPVYFAATAYAAGQILEDAIRKAGSTDRRKIRDILSSLSSMSIVGRYGVDQRGMQIRNFTMVVQVQGGKRQIVWPLKLMQQAPVFK